MQDKLNCVYTRVSTDNQAEVEFNSCEAQEAKIKYFIYHSTAQRRFTVRSYDPILFDFLVECVTIAE